MLQTAGFQEWQYLLSMPRAGVKASQWCTTEYSHAQRLTDASALLLTRALFTHLPGHRQSACHKGLNADPVLQMTNQSESGLNDKQLVKTTRTTTRTSPFRICSPVARHLDHARAISGWYACVCWIDPYSSCCNGPRHQLLWPSSQAYQALTPGEVNYKRGTSS